MTVGDAVLRFPDGFVWGAATAAYQVEGAVDEDGRGPSIWDTFASRPGSVRRGDTGRIACEHYRRYPADLDLARSLGLQATRFSVAWPRIFPTGGGRPNRRGLDHYRAVAEACLDRGIAPVVTLYHWDLPQALQDLGGWAVRDTAYRFAEYAATVHDALGDLVDTWITLNEPAVVALAGHADGSHAPGIRDGALSLRATHHLLLAHGLALARMRVSADPGRIGITLNHWPAIPATRRPQDVAAANRRDAHGNRMYFDPILRGRYPATMLDWYGGDLLPCVQDQDLALIGAPIDFLGLNYYSVNHVAERSGPAGPDAWPFLNTMNVPEPDKPRDTMGWAQEPDGLRDLLITLDREYPSLPPVYITENGTSYDDYVSPEGIVNDVERIEYFDQHLRAVHQAITAGVDVRGFFAWSFMDNFEWAHGYAKRFGLVYVDFGTQRRIPKQSALWYRDVIARHGVPAAPTGADQHDTSHV